MRQYNYQTQQGRKAKVSRVARLWREDGRRVLAALGKAVLFSVLEDLA